MDEAKQVKIPLALTVLGVLLTALYGATFGGTEGAGAGVLAAVIWLVIGVPVAVLGCYLTAAIIGASYGYLSTAILKLAACFVFPTAVSFFVFVPMLDWMVALALYFALLAWLFELEVVEIIVTAFVIWLVRLITFLVIGAVLASLG